MSKLEKVLDKVQEAIKEMQKDKVIVKTLPMKAEWKKMQQECMALALKVESLRSELDAKRDFMWGTIKTAIGIYNANLHINEDMTEIQVYED